MFPFSINPQRPKRSLFQWVSNYILQPLLRLTSEKQYKQLRGQLRALQGDVSQQVEALNDLKNNFINIVTLENDRIDTLKSAIDTNSQAISRSDLLHTTKLAFYKMYDLWVTMISLKSLPINLSNLVTSGFAKFSQHIQTLTMYDTAVRAWLLALQFVKFNHISTLIVYPQQLCQEIAKVELQLHKKYPNFRLMFTHPRFIYDFESFTFYSDTDNIYINLNYH